MNQSVTAQVSGPYFEPEKHGSLLGVGGYRGEAERVDTEVLHGPQPQRAVWSHMPSIDMVSYALKYLNMILVTSEAHVLS